MIVNSKQMITTCTTGNSCGIVISKYHLIFMLSYVILVIVLVLILMVDKAKSTGKSMQYSLSGAYLNHSSTSATKHGLLNPSDLAYPQNLELRLNVENYENRIRKLINAPIHSKVIINSGATESIANCVFWAKSYNKFGSIVGTSFDHSSVADNCRTFEVNYEQNLNSAAISERCSMIILTHVDSKTGEILDINSFHHNFSTYTFLNQSASSFGANIHHPFNVNTRQYKPLVVLDAAQSIMKVPIDMEKWQLNAVFFSLHKIGGPIGLGVLVVNDFPEAPFKPLISGKQQHSLRGGTIPLQSLFINEDIFDNYDDMNSRVETWQNTMKLFKESGLTVYEPTHKHLHNTFLIEVNGCPMEVISELALDGIYVGNTTACKNEELMDKSNGPNEDTDVDNGKHSNKPFENSIRISFVHPSELNQNVISKIITAVKKSYNVKNQRAK